MYSLPKEPHNILGMVDTWEIASLKSMCGAWNGSWQESDFSGPEPGPEDYLFGYFSSQQMEELPFSPVAWHPKWLHFMNNHFGDRYYIDLAPRPTGQIGQIIFWPGSRRGGIPKIIAPNIQSVLTTIVEELEAGKYTFDDSTGILWSQETFSTLDEETLLYLRDLRQRGSKP
jgi:cell wall assembly regulator SMI1